MSQTGPSARHARIGIVTVSDRAFAGTYEDRGGPAIQDWLTEHLESPGDLLIRGDLFRLFLPALAVVGLAAPATPRAAAGSWGGLRGAAWTSVAAASSAPGHRSAPLHEGTAIDWRAAGLELGTAKPVKGSR